MNAEWYVSVSLVSVPLQCLCVRLMTMLQLFREGEGI